MPRPANPVERVELSRMMVDRPLFDRLKQLVDRTGASASYHRRKALEAYLDEHQPETDS